MIIVFPLTQNGVLPNKLHKFNIRFLTLACKIWKDVLKPSETFTIRGDIFTTKR
jgi:hypothetical protein